MMDIITRKEAKEKGLSHYFTGKLCKHGHVSIRLTVDGTCMECKRLYKKTAVSKKHYNRYRKTYKKKVNERSRLWHRDNMSKKLKDLRKTDPDKAYAAARRWSKRNPWYGVSLNSSRRKQIRQATPKWANKKEIINIYKKAHQLSKENHQYHVDHIIPLISDVVCGLHCEDNLQIILAFDNIRKSNSFAIS